MVQLENGRVVNLGDTVTLISDSYRVASGSKLKVVEDDDSSPYWTDTFEKTVQIEALILFPDEFE